MKIADSNLRDLVSILVEAVANRHSSIYGRGNTSNIPNLKGVEVLVQRANNDIMQPKYNVCIEVSDRSDLNVNVNFLSENEANHYARSYVNYLKGLLGLESLPK